MIRGAIALTATAAAVGGLIITGHHPHTRSAPAGSAKPTPTVSPTHASRAETRRPLPVVKRQAHRRQGTSRPRHSVGRARPATGSGTYADTTMYCATGNRNAAGRWPRLGDVAVLDRSIRFGTRVLIAGRTYLVEDWIGSGSQFDIFGGDDDGCEQRALDYGRRHLRVVVER